MFYLKIVDVLNWMNLFLLITILGFLFFWYIQIYYLKKKKVISKIYFFLNLGISLFNSFFLIWSWMTFYLLEQIYHLNIEQTNSIILTISFCLVSLVLDLILVIYIFIFHLNFFLIIEDHQTLKLGWWKIKISDLSHQNQKIYFKKKKIVRLNEQNLKKKIVDLSKQNH